MIWKRGIWALTVFKNLSGAGYDCFGMELALYSKRQAPMSRRLVSMIHKTHQPSSIRWRKTTREWLSGVRHSAESTSETPPERVVHPERSSKLVAHIDDLADKDLLFKINNIFAWRRYCADEFLSGSSRGRAAVARS
jgi:hypothetical protein